jgi:hypothetical protein
LTIANIHQETNIRKGVPRPFLGPHSCPLYKLLVLREGILRSIFVVMNFVVSEARSVNKIQCTSRKPNNQAQSSPFKRCFEYPWETFSF